MRLTTTDCQIVDSNVTLQGRTVRVQEVCRIRGTYCCRKARPKTGDRAILVGRSLENVQIEVHGNYLKRK